MPRDARVPIVAWPVSSELDGVDFVGECAEFCAYRTFGRGIPVAQHGPLCLSEPCGREVDAALADGSAVEVTSELARPYRNGSYALANASVPRRSRLVRLTSSRSDSHGTDGELELFLTPGDALRLAMELKAVARRLDQVTH
jgi:hypothetical protein